MNDALFSLSDAVAALREDIAAAVAQGVDERIRFALRDIELEFAVVARREGAADGKLKFSILGLGAEAGATARVTQEQTQKVRIKLAAQLDAGDGTSADLLVRRRVVSGASRS